MPFAEALCELCEQLDVTQRRLMVTKTDPIFAGVAELEYEVVARYPHDPQAFTEGLEYYDGFLYESTGLKGASSLRRVDVQTGEIKDLIPIGADYFAEGLTILEGQIFQLTWKQGVCFVYDVKTLRKTQEFTYTGEGWGLTNDGTHLIMSDKTNMLHFRDPKTFKELSSPIEVAMDGRPVSRLNELEYVRGFIYANVFPKSWIVCINAENGAVVARADLSKLQPKNADVLNGITVDPGSGHFFVTGKNWNMLYEIRLINSFAEQNSSDAEFPSNLNRPQKGRQGMATKTKSTKKSAKKAGSKQQDPPVIVGGGGSVLIKIRKDLGITGGGVVGPYKVYKIRYVDALALDVYEDENSSGSPFLLDPETHQSVYWDDESLQKRASFLKAKRR